MSKIRNFLPQVLMVLAIGVLPAAAQSNWKVVNTFHVGGDGGWDYVTMDTANHRLFVTRATHTIVVDEQTGKVLGDIAGQTRSHGVALAPAVGRGFITDGGGAGSIVVFDLKTYAVLGKIPAAPDVDGAIFDAKLNRVLAVSGDGNELFTFSPDIDPKSGKLDAPIALGGAPEFLASDGSGKVYINLEDKNLVAVVDLKSRKVVNRWPVAPGGHPVGMSIDPAAHRLFIGCRNPQMLVVMNAETGAIEGSVPIGAGVDATAYGNGQAFASTGDGALTVASLKGGQWAAEQTVETQKGARTMGIDVEGKRIFLPTAELLPQASGRPMPKPGTFMIVEVGR